MDINNLCYGCMREKDSPEGICPYCGFERTVYEEKRSIRALPTGTILNGKYILGKVLGEGGFGITYLAMDLNLQMPVAIKEYFPVGLASRDTSAGENTENVSVITGEKRRYYEYGIKSFSAEARNLARFQKTEGVISVKDFFLENNTAYLAMEYISGKTLKQYLEEINTPLSEAETLRLIRPILDALVSVHAEGIIHRDVSPENIMLAKDGRVVLIDFGAARIATGAETKSLTVLLKHGYAPVEQYQTRGKQGPYTDIYAVCATIYRMLSGEKPEEAIDRMVDDKVIPLERKSGLHISHLVSEAVQKGLSVQSQDRYQTVQELIQSLYKDDFPSVQQKQEKAGIETSGYMNPQNQDQEGTEYRKKEWKSRTAAGVIIAVLSLCVLGAIFVLMDRGTNEVIQSDIGATIKEETGDSDEYGEATPEESGNDMPNETSPEKKTTDAVTDTQKQGETEPVLTSKRMWEKDGTVYTVYDIHEPGYVSISGQYIDTMVVDGDRIYWRKTTEGEQQCSIISMKMDGTDQKTLTEKAHSSTFLGIIGEDLYYTAVNDEGEKQSIRIDLQTGKEEEAPPYMLRAGNDKAWFSTSLKDDKWYCSAPGYENIHPGKGIKGTMLDVIGTKGYYMYQNDDGTYVTCTYDSETDQNEIILKDQPAKSVVSGSGLYYKQIVDGNTVLHRIDLKSGEQTEYNLGDFNLYMGGGFYELENEICVIRFVPEKGEMNTEFWAVSRTTGEKRLIGQWYNSNAENAAKEP